MFKLRRNQQLADNSALDCTGEDVINMGFEFSINRKYNLASIRSGGRDLVHPTFFQWYEPFVMGMDIKI